MLEERAMFKNIRLMMEALGYDPDPSAKAPKVTRNTQKLLDLQLEGLFISGESNRSRIFIKGIRNRVWATASQFDMPSQASVWDYPSKCPSSSKRYNVGMCGPYSTTRG